ncbi:MAG: glycosyltransferase family 4 protein, partial [Deltaproteobacteria bacterium]|nr:glycosyltransferase family 4 protein [Deltaproteobacteria bacterium]
YLGQQEKPYGEFEIKADLTVGCSHFVLASERNRLARGSLRQGVIQNGVDTEAFRPAWIQETSALDLRRGYGLEEKKVVLYTGKIRESKGVGLLWAAMKEVFRRDVRAVLVLAGGTGFGYKRVNKKTIFLNHLQREMQDYRDRVLFLGFIPPQEIPKIYLLGDVFVAPSQLEEGLGMVFLEASASGLPVIGTRQGGIPEAVIDQKTGLLLREKDNVTELSEKIINLLEHPEYGKELGHNGRQFMVDHFAWPKVAEATEALYDSLFSERPAYGTFGQGK